MASVFFNIGGDFTAQISGMTVEAVDFSAKETKGQSLWFRNADHHAHHGIGVPENLPKPIINAFQSSISITTAKLIRQV